MFAIGEFARHGRVSIRMLRHYDALGLLRPAYVDPSTGYRSYTAGQLADLNRIVALKDLGFTLEQVGAMKELGPDELRAMLTLRRAQLESTVAESYARLAQVESRLRSLEGDGPAADVVVKELPAVRLIGLTATAASFTPDDITPVVRPLCAELGRRLTDADVHPSGRLTCLYERNHESEDEVVVRATVPAAVDAGGNLHGLEVIDLPAMRAATLVHRGPIDQVLPSWQALARWIDDNGHRAAEPARELYLDTPDDLADWVTELQEPLD
ncbi:MerR family transcriptional regulator [Kribbella jiaozuonensis]|uniref:MerR family transcriptional regulator n=1 Tax=Kribbella jiaozuonensis TaxID=2575441 RepID=A0A4U3LUE9_9ACTN|nr:MerR family transcriptional regulator [Kribbella jiaozuonensis]TKK79440.1 MerR family transcriptional regulator [Kribbella jiaozuonensis]